ncbi:hypothetical protein ACKWTF_000261 [Chironomus riparius]
MNGWEQKSIKTLHCSEIEAKITGLKTNDFCQMTSYVTDIRKGLSLASVAAINEQKQVKSIDWKIGKLMILIDFVHDFNFFFLFMPAFHSCPIIYFVSKIKEQDTLRAEEKCQSQQESFFFLLYKNLLCLSFFVNSTQIVPHKYLLIHVLSLFFSILILFTNFSRYFVD